MGKYYSLKNILAKNAHYNVIIGERSNGKTYAALKYGLEQHIKNGSQLAVVRRWQDDYKGKRGASMFDALCTNGEVAKLTNGEWTGVYYYASRWFLCRKNEKDEREVKEEPFAFAFAVSSMEHDKSTSYPRIRTVVFDEFVTRSAYLPDEFVLFMNVLSTIIRDRNDVKIFMLANTVNKYAPYFSEMGLTHIKDMKQGDIDVYQYGDGALKVAVEFAGSPTGEKKSNVYFAFDNPKLSMITGRGNVWEIDIYPHRPIKFKPKDIVFTFFILFGGDTLQCEFVQVEELFFLYIHRKTGDIKEIDTDIVYSPEFSVRPNWRRRVTNVVTPLEGKIGDMFFREKVFYQDNEVGEIVRNYLKWCRTKA